MEFDGLKIGSKNPQAEVLQKKEADEGTYDIGSNMITDAEIGFEVLNEVKEIKLVENENVIYGVYDNSDKSVWVKINDFLIDNSKITLRDKSYFFHMLAVMVDAGIPVVKAVKSLAGRSENQRFRRVLNTVAYLCERGTNLSDAMSRFDNVFDESELGIIKSGEETGKLHVMLFKLSDKLDKRHDLTLKLWGAAIYPIVVLCVLILVAIGMLVWIFPSLLSLLKEGGVSSAKLPFATKLLIAVQGAVVNYWWLMLAIIFLIYGIFAIYKNSAYGAVKWDLLKLHIPIVGTLLRKVYVFNFITLLGLLIEAGLPVMTVIAIAGNSIPNRIYRLKAQEILSNVKKGGKISESLQDCEFLFPVEIAQMIAVGEGSASLGQISEKIGGQYEIEIDTTIRKLASIFEPVMILFVALLVALLALAIMAPIFNLSSTIS